MLTLLNALSYVLTIPVLLTPLLGALVAWRSMDKNVYLDLVVLALIAVASLLLAAAGFGVRALARGSSGAQVGGLVLAIVALLASMGPPAQPDQGRMSIWNMQYVMLTRHVTA